MRSSGSWQVERPAAECAARPPPWTIEDSNNACFIVSDRNGQALGYFYFEEESGRRTAGKLMSYDEARRIAASIAKLLDLLQS